MRFSEMEDEQPMLNAGLLKGTARDMKNVFHPANRIVLPRGP